MSEFEYADVVESGVMFVLGVGKSVAHLDEENARLLRDDLNRFLGEDKQPSNCLWNVGDRIESCSDEPDLPVGSIIKDHSVYNDRAVRTADGWRWQTLLGSPSGKDFEWEQWQEQSWTVISVGK